MAQSTQTPNRIKKWTERLTLVSLIAAILGVTMWAAAQWAWRKFVNPPPPARTRFISYDPWLSMPTEKQAGATQATPQASCTPWGVRPPGGTVRCIPDDHLLYETCFPSPEDVPKQLKNVVACVSNPEDDPYFVRTPKRVKPDKAFRDQGRRTARTVWQIHLTGKADRCFTYAGTHYTFEGRTIFMACEKGTALGLSTRSQPWVALYAEEGESLIEQVPVDSAWF